MSACFEHPKNVQNWHPYFVWNIYGHKKWSCWDSWLFLFFLWPLARHTCHVMYQYVNIGPSFIYMFNVRWKSNRTCSLCHCIVAQLHVFGPRSAKTDLADFVIVLPKDGFVDNLAHQLQPTFIPLLRVIMHPWLTQKKGYRNNALLGSHPFLHLSDFSQCHPKTRDVTNNVLFSYNGSKDGKTHFRVEWLMII